MARAQTSYIGVVQAREQLARSRRKEWAKVARIALIAVGVALGVFAMATGRASVGVKSAPAPAKSSSR